MDLTRDTYEYILNFADDTTVLNMLSVNKKFRDEKLFEQVMKKRYPKLIQYRKKNETFVNLYIRMIYLLAKLSEDFGIIYDIKLGDPEKYYKTLKELYKKERFLFSIDADNWYGNMPEGKDIPFNIRDPDHQALRESRYSILTVGGKVVPSDQLPKRAKVVWKLSQQMQKKNLFEKLGYEKYYKKLAKKLKRFEKENTNFQDHRDNH
jgi:hypothetical protein